jgi:hypothetical protein
MSRGDYYHDAVNHRRSMRGGSTQAERGLAAEMREMHPKRDNTTNDDYTMASNQFHFLLNQVVHDKNTEPFKVPGAMTLINNVFQNQRWRNFDRTDGPTFSQIEHQNNQRGEIPKDMDQMRSAAYPDVTAHTEPFDYDAKKADLAKYMKRENIAFIPKQLHAQLKDYARRNNLTIPSEHATFTDAKMNEKFITDLEKQKKESIEREMTGVPPPPNTFTPGQQREPLPSLPVSESALPLRFRDAIDYMPGMGFVTMAQIAKQQKDVAREQAILANLAANAPTA